MADDADPELTADPEHGAAEDDTQSRDDPPDAEESPDDHVTHTRAATPDHPGRRRRRLLVGALSAVVLTGLTGWMGWQLYQTRSHQQQRSIYLNAARQGALNLTTIDYREADTDIQRILDGSTGAFHDDFQLRAQPFIETVKQAQSTSVGTISAAALESSTDNGAQALIAVTVKTSLAGVEQPEPRAWRMRINVENAGNEAKVSNVAFVP